MKSRDLLILSVLLPALMLPACAAKKTVVTVVPEDGPKGVRIEASSFSFVPTVIRAHQGDRLVLRVVNGAGIAHNLTVKNPRGEPAARVDLPAGATVEIPLELTEAGSWPYYCDKTFHETLGMSGRIEAAPRR
jgi:plastocyanin